MSSTRMEASSLRLSHPAAAAGQPSNNGGPPNGPEFNQRTRYTGPRPQPVDIVIPSAAPSPQEDHVLEVVQQPEIAKVAAPKEKVRTPLDPPLVVELSFQTQESNRTYLSSPFFFGSVELVPERPPRPTERRQFQSAMIGGSLVSSLHKVRLDDGLDHAFFVFGDLNVKVVGRFQLTFTLFEMHKRDNGEFHVVQLGSIQTNTFKAYASKDFPGQMESTQLSKQLCDQGIKLRIRKETSKRKAHTSDWMADHYMNPHAPGSNYARGSYGPYHPGYGPHDLRNTRRRYSPQPYAMGAAPAPDRHLPGISTLPPGLTLPHPSAHAAHPSASLLSPTTAFPLESSLRPVTRPHFTSMRAPERHGSRAWPPHAAARGDTSPYLARREPNTHEYGHPSGFEHYPNLSSPARFSPNDASRQEMAGSLGRDDRDGRRPPNASSYAHAPAYSRHEVRRDSAIPDAGRSRGSAASAMLPPIVPGPYVTGTRPASTSSSPFPSETAFDDPAVQPRQPPNRLDRTMGDQQHDAGSRRAGPPV